MRLGLMVAARPVWNGELVSKLAEHLKIGRERIGIAGLKDKAAVTMQEISIDCVSPGSIRADKARRRPALPSHAPHACACSAPLPCPTPALSLTSPPSPGPALALLTADTCLAHAGAVHEQRAQEGSPRQLALELPRPAPRSLYICLLRDLLCLYHGLYICPFRDLLLPVPWSVYICPLTNLFLSLPFLSLKGPSLCPSMCPFMPKP